MDSIFRINASKIDKIFLQTIKLLFEKREVEITITDAESDETAFLLRDPENKVHLLKAVEEVKQNKNLVHFSAKEFEKYSQSLLRK